MNIKEDIIIADYSRDAMIKDSLAPLINSYLPFIPEYDDFYVTQLAITKNIKDGDSIEFVRIEMTSGESSQFGHFMCRYGFFKRIDKENIFSEKNIYEITDRGRVLKKCGSLEIFVQQEIKAEEHEKWVKEKTTQSLNIQLKNATFQNRLGNFIPFVSVIIALTSTIFSVYTSLTANKKIERYTYKLAYLERKAEAQNTYNKAFHKSIQRIEAIKNTDTLKAR